MVAKKGTKLKENTKDYMLRVRMDKDTVQRLEHCCEVLQLSKSEVVRQGIAEISAKIK